MPDYSLVPVDYQPDFEGVSLVPVDYDPFAGDGATQQAQIQQAQPQGPPQQQPATGAGQPDASAPAAGGGPSGSEGGGIGPIGGAPNPALDQGAATAARFGGYSLVPVDYQPDFEDYSLVPVDYDPFPEDGPAQQAQFQLPTLTQPAQPQPQSQPQQPATGAGQPGVNGPATGNSPSGSEGGGIGPTGGAPNPTLDQGAAKAAPFGGYSLVPVDYQPDFDGYYPFAADGLTQQAQFQQPPTPTQPAQPQPQTQPQQPATGAGQPGVNGPATGNSPSGSGGGAGAGNAGIDPGNPTWAQGWSPESAAYDGFSHPTPAQPLTDDQRALIRQKIVEAAQKQIGSRDWDTEVEKGNFPKGTNKCNLFVHEMLTGAGAGPGTPNGWRHPSPPTAGQWANPSYAIPGWRVLGPDESPQPGDVAAQPGNYSDATGHVVIVGPNNTFIGVGPPEHPEIPGDPEKIESIPKKDNIVTLPAKGPLLYRRFVGR